MHASSVEDVRLPARMRFQFEHALGDVSNFRRAFDSELSAYSRHVSLAFKAVFELPQWVQWAEEKGLEIVTWHYLTRHTIFSASPFNQYFSGQIVFSRRLRNLLTDEELEPYRGIKSPYIGIFKDERVREGSGLGGPLCILLPCEESAVVDQLRSWTLSIPPSVTALLLQFPDHDGRHAPLDASHLRQIETADPRFMAELVEWMAKSRGQESDAVEALNYLQASLKVTLNLLRRSTLNCSLPRSTFLCPTYLGGEEVGGMAFACTRLVDRQSVLIGEAVSNILLSYLRLREDAQAHVLVEQQQKLDEAKRFFIDRLSHDFRHPIDTLQSTVSEFSRLFKVIHQQIGQINRMMDDTILAIEGRDPQTLLQPKKREDKVAEFVADIRLYFRKQFSDKRKELIVEPVEPDWMISLDPGMVHEILENLIVNSLEHGGMVTKLSVERLPDKYLFHVRDNGPGIPEERRDLIFRPLINSDRGEGMRRGRGLAIARMLAEAHGGTLQLGSSEDRWATHFILEIPNLYPGVGNHGS